MHAPLKCGILPSELAKIKCGNLSQSRWSTTYQALMMLWTRFHSVEAKTLRILELLIRFCLTVYLQLCYEIKVKHYIILGPRSHLEECPKRPDKVKNLIRNLIQGGANHAHSQNLPTSLLTSADEDDRKFDVDKILPLRIVQDQGNMEVRYRKTPTLNLHLATT